MRLKNRILTTHETRWPFGWGLLGFALFCGGIWWGALALIFH